MTREMANLLVDTYGISTLRAGMVRNIELVCMGNMMADLYRGMPSLQSIENSNRMAVKRVLDRLEEKQEVGNVRELLKETGDRVKKVIRNHPPGEARALFKEIERQRSANEEVFSVNMERALRTYAVGKKFHLPDDQLQTLVQAALVCDVGSPLLPRDILEVSESELTDEQRNIFEWYPALSHTMLYDLEQEAGGIVAQVAGAHRQTFDGGGFGVYKPPHQVRGTEVLLEGWGQFYSELVHITHRYAMALKREHRPLPEVISKMNQFFKRGDFNPDLYRAFYETFDAFLPRGMEVPVEMILGYPQLITLGRTELESGIIDQLKSVNDRDGILKLLAKSLWDGGFRGIVGEEKQNKTSAVFFIGKREWQGDKLGYCSTKSLFRNKEILVDLGDKLSFPQV